MEYDKNNLPPYIRKVRQWENPMEEFGINLSAEDIFKMECLGEQERAVINLELVLEKYFNQNKDEAKDKAQIKGIMETYLKYLKYQIALNRKMQDIRKWDKSDEKNKKAEWFLSDDPADDMPNVLIERFIYGEEIDKKLQSRKYLLKKTMIVRLYGTSFLDKEKMAGLKKLMTENKILHKLDCSSCAITITENNIDEICNFIKALYNKDLDWEIMLCGIINDWDLEVDLSQYIGHFLLDEKVYDTLRTKGFVAFYRKFV